MILRAFNFQYFVSHRDTALKCEKPWPLVDLVYHGYILEQRMIAEGVRKAEAVTAQAVPKGPMIGIDQALHNLRNCSPVAGLIVAEIQPLTNLLVLS